MSMMTPRTVVTALPTQQTVGETLQEFAHNIPFARIPVYEEKIDNVVGIVRAVSFYRQKSRLLITVKIVDLIKTPTVIYVPETATAYQALQSILKAKQQLAIVVDEFGSLVGVLSLEDIMEYIIGEEIYERR